MKVQVGRVHEKPVGPHPAWSCQLAFSAAEFDKVIPWLDEHRGTLDVFVHGLTGDDLADHTTHAYWLGNEWPLNLAFQRARFTEPPTRPPPLPFFFPPPLPRV